MSARNDDVTPPFHGPAPTRRRKLPHHRPDWVTEDAIYFVTICALPRNVNHLCHPALGSRIRDTVAHRESLGQWWVHLLLLMPDHVHLLVSDCRDGLTRTLRDWKRFTRRHLAIRWQRDFFDHRLRRDESLEEKAEYIRNNPVRAGLVQRAEDWPYLWQKCWDEMPGRRRGRWLARSW